MLSESGFGGSTPGKDRAHHRDTSAAHSCSSPGSAWEARVLKVNCHQIKSVVLMLPEAHSTGSSLPFSHAAKFVTPHCALVGISELE